jgi:spermidine synthase
VQPVADVRQMLAQVQGPLLAVLRISPDFRPAREPLQRMAHALAQADAPAAQPLLQALTEIDAQSGQALRRVTSGSATQP